MPLVRSLSLPPPTDDDEFDDLVTESLQARHKNLHLVRLGRSGQAQHGIDGWDSVNPRGLVWQATLQKDRLLEKLERDLAAFDQSPFGPRSPFIFVLGVPRDAKLQRQAQVLCEQRLAENKCPVEVLFWSDLVQFFSLSMLSRYYPQFIPPVISEAAVTRGLLSLGWDVILHASLVEQEVNRWVLTLGDHILGSPGDVSSFIERFRLESDAAWVSFEGLGVSRTLAAAPVLRGRKIDLALGERSPRIDVYKTGTNIALDEDGDIFPDLRTISGFPAAVQRMCTAMSTKLGEWFLNARVGTRCAAFYKMNLDATTLGGAIATELARLAFLPSGDKEPRLPFIDRVVSVEVPDVQLISGELHTTATVELTGHGEWRGPLRIFIQRPT